MDSPGYQSSEATPQVVSAVSPAPQPPVIPAHGSSSAPPVTGTTGTGVVPAQADKPGLIEFLRQVVGGPQSPWRRATTAGDILARVKAVHEAMEVIHDLGWQTRSGGYEIPNGAPPRAQNINYF